MIQGPAIPNILDLILKTPWIGQHLGAKWLTHSEYS